MAKNKYGATEVIVFNGIAFRRSPNSPRGCDRDYYSPNASHRKRGVGDLHREIWKDAHGPIPEGYEIHHKDHNTLNNALDNLELISIADHHAHHDQGYTPEQLRIKRERMRYVQRAATNWHKSAEGHEWHQELARKAVDARYMVKRVCERCGKEYEVNNILAFRSKIPSRFCSAICKNAARKASGVDHEQRVCAYCGKTFSIHRYAKNLCCSKQCAQRLRAGHPKPM